MLIPFFPPMGGGGVYRPLSFVSHLPRHGWRTTVIAPRGDAFWISDPSLAQRVPAECRVIRTRTLSGQGVLARARGGRASPRRSSRGFALARRAAAALLVPDTYAGWRPFAQRAALAAARLERFDALYSTSPPESTHLAALSVHRRTGLPWVADFRDPWMNLHLLDPPSALHARLHRRMEARVCAGAEVVVTTRWHEAALRAAHPLARVVRIGNGFDGDEVRAVEEVRPAPRPFRVVHAGMLTQGRSAVPFLEALARWLASAPDARGEVAVEFLGPREDANERALSRLGLGDVARFCDTLPHAETLRAERAAHVLLLIKHANPRYDGLVPGKLYEYIGLARPVLALAPPGEARDLVQTLRRGETADPSDVAEIARRLGVMFAHYRAGRLDASYDLSPRPEFDRARLAGELAALLDRVAAGGRS
jgi:glycosyltransferase involved in cell wall biosynthesis